MLNRVSHNSRKLYGKKLKKMSVRKGTRMFKMALAHKLSGSAEPHFWGNFRNLLSSIGVVVTVINNIAVTVTPKERQNPN